MNVSENIYPVYNLKRKSFVFKKSVSFHCMVDVILIPNIKNFPELFDSLWWHQESLNNFKRSSFEEIINFVKVQENMHNRISCKQACDLLYQPNPTTIIKPSLPDKDNACFFSGFTW